MSAKPQPEGEQQTTGPLPEAILNNLSKAAEAVALAAGFEGQAEAAAADVTRLTADLKIASEKAATLGRSQMVALKTAEDYREMAYGRAQALGYSHALVVAADQAAQAAAAAAPRKSCANCLQPIYQATNQIWLHEATQAEKCYPDSPSSPLAQPRPADDPLGQNGHMPSPEGAPR